MRLPPIDPRRHGFAPGWRGAAGGRGGEAAPLCKFSPKRAGARTCVTIGLGDRRPRARARAAGAEQTSVPPSPLRPPSPPLRPPSARRGPGLPHDPRTLVEASRTILMPLIEYQDEGRRRRGDKSESFANDDSSLRATRGAAMP